MSQTLFLKDSVLFISIDGETYEVESYNIFYQDDCDYFVLRHGGEFYHSKPYTWEWPYGVELITIAPHPECNKARECLQLTDGLNCSQAYDARIRDTSLCAKAYNVARLLPKEKKEPDHQQFEEPEQCGGVRCQVGHTCFEDCSVESSEPHEKGKIIIEGVTEWTPVESHEELASKAFDQLWDILESIRNEDYTVSDDNRKLIDELFTRLTP